MTEHTKGSCATCAAALKQFKEATRQISVRRETAKKELEQEYEDKKKERRSILASVRNREYERFEKDYKKDYEEKLNQALLALQSEQDEKHKLCISVFKIHEDTTHESYRFR